MFDFGQVEVEEGVEEGEEFVAGGEVGSVHHSYGYVCGAHGWWCWLVDLLIDLMVMEGADLSNFSSIALQATSNRSPITSDFEIAHFFLLSSFSSLPQINIVVAWAYLLPLANYRRSQSSQRAVKG